MIFSRFFVYLSFFAVVSAGRFLEEEEADPCMDATAALQETDAYINATATLYTALDEFAANATGACVVVDERVECKGALPADVSSEYEASCAAMEGIIITSSNMRITCDFPDEGNTYTVIETFYDCVAPVCDEDGQSELVDELLSSVDEHKEGNGTFCFVVDGESGAFATFSIGVVLMSLAAMFAL